MVQYSAFAFQTVRLKTRPLLAIATMSLLVSACVPAPLSQMDRLVRNADYDILLPNREFSTGESAHITFQTLKNGKPYDVGTDGRMLHVILSDAEMQDMVHAVNPIGLGDALFDLPHTFTEPGRYRVWIEITDPSAADQHGESAELIAFADLTVSGQTVPPLPNPSPAFKEGYRLVLDTPAVHAGQAVMLRFSVRDPDDAPVELLPFDALLYGLTGQNLSFYQHGHADTARDGFSMTFPVTFPAPGTYGLVAQATFLRGEGFDWIEDRLAIEVK